MVLPQRYVLSFLLKLWGRYQLNQLCRDAQRGDEVPGVLLEWFGAAEGYESSDFAQLCTKLKTNVFSPKRSNFTLALQTNISYRSSVTHNNFPPGKLLAFLCNWQVQKHLLAEILRRHQDSPYAFQNGLQGDAFDTFLPILPPFAWFLAHFLCHVRGVATYDLFRESHPLTEPGHDLNGALGKELSTHEVEPC